MTIESFQQLNIPDSPGVYFWKEGGVILYIGKATSLRDRVRSYFGADLIHTRGPRLVDMVTRADSIEWVQTDSVLEAMIAEANLIKKHWPHYNVKDKDDRSFNYVLITKEDFPRLVVLRGRAIDVEKRRREIKSVREFGPFPNGAALRAALKLVRRMFPYLDEKTGTRSAGDKYHFYRQIGLAPDMSSAEAKEEYRKTIKQIILFFEGKKGALVRELEKEMRDYAKRQEFEKAGEAKRRLFSLNHIQDIALIKEDVEAVIDMNRGPIGTGRYRVEAYDTAHMSGKESAGVMVVVEDGEAAKSEYRKFKLSPEIGNNDVASLREIIERRMNHPEWRFPDLIVIDGGDAQRNLALKVLAERDQDISVVSVVKDERHKPKGLIGPDTIVERHKKAILLANAEAHRFAIAYHRKLRRMRNNFRGRL